MSPLANRIARLLAVVPAIFMMTMANVFIGFTVAGVVLLQMITNGVNKHVSLATAILVAVAVHLYIIFNHKIRAYINKHSQGTTENE